ncbi:MAG: lysozyme [Lactococcus sp.]|uniref:Lysozyme n=2 Tax=Pseudolactococcus TaxID=3436058 RepID=A0A0D6DW75_9LACT|nr:MULTISPECIES: lysozyme [Lactococcus]MDN5464975.1 lysozyme [Lactococcus lactis]MCJ1990273.1 lysozyme [Lactococcus carnosus]MCJ2002853.1 lysozyme [Lactococcus carnosus]MDN5410377.1 lysozyme [Lactococcus sp.]MDN5412009.1 lysozyme [Lactococcus sp.]
MKTGVNGLNLIKEFEGCRLTAYDIGDGKITIGWGHAEPVGRTNLIAGVTTWSQSQADSQLVADLVEYENAVDSFFTRSFNQNQYDALVSFAYNLGGGVFSRDGWGRNANNASIAYDIMLYCNKGTPYEAGITRRRKAEVALYNSDSVDNNSNDTSNEVKKEKGELKMFIAQCSGGDVNQYIKNGTFVLFNLSRGIYSVLNGQGQVDAVTEGHQLATGNSLSKGFMNNVVITNLINGSKLDYRG